MAIDAKPSAIVTHSTDDVPAHQRVRYWNDWSSATIARSTIRPRTRDAFNGRVSVLETPVLRFANFVSDPATLTHTRSHIAAQDERALVLHYQLGGASLNVQDGRETVIRASDYTLCDASRPYDLAFDQVNDMLSLRIPERVFRQRLDAPELLTCVHMSGQNGIGRLTSNFIRSCWAQYLDGLDAELQRKLAENILDLLVTSYAAVYRSEVEQSSIASARKLVVREMIEENLHNPELSPAYLAGALGYSPAHLHKIFRVGDETICQYILRRRLEDAGRVLGDPLRGGRTLGEVAFGLGFKSATHFGRAFREKYGQCPSEYRREKLKESTARSEYLRPGRKPLRS